MMDINSWGMVIAILNFVTMAVVIPTWAYVRKLKDNHLKHIEDAVSRLEVKFDRHIEQHFGGISVK